MLRKGNQGEGFGEGIVDYWPGWVVWRIHILMIFGYFLTLISQGFFWRSLFRIFPDFCVPMGSKTGGCLIHFVHFLVIRCIWENCALAAVSARFSRFQGFSNHTFSMFVQVMFLSVFLRLSFFDFL